MHQAIITRLTYLSSADKAKVLARFFQTGPGQYGEGDRFIGVTVPKVREVAREFSSATFEDIHRLLQSEIHEARLCALLILVEQYRRARRDAARRAEIVRFYLDHATQANNWDLVDLSCPKILGQWLAQPDTNPGADPEILFTLARSGNLWLERIAIVSTMPLIAAGRFDITLTLAEQYLTHPHPLIHKATGWMLREIGKRHLPTLLTFLDAHASAMPRTALRYALEKLSADLRSHYLTLPRVK